MNDRAFTVRPTWLLPGLPFLTLLKDPFSVPRRRRCDFQIMQCLYTPIVFYLFQNLVLRDCFTGGIRVSIFNRMWRPFTSFFPFCLLDVNQNRDGNESLETRRLGGEMCIWPKLFRRVGFLHHGTVSSMNKYHSIVFSRLLRRLSSSALVRLNKKAS